MRVISQISKIAEFTQDISHELQDVTDFVSRSNSDYNGITDIGFVLCSRIGYYDIKRQKSICPMVGEDMIETSNLLSTNKPSKCIARSP